MQPKEYVNTERAAGTGVTASRLTLGAWVKTICRALDAAGCDSTALLAEVGVDIKSLDGPSTLFPLTLSIYLWKCALKATGDPAFGIKAASHIKSTSFHALSYGIGASSTLKEAFERAERYGQVVSDAVEYEFLRIGDEYHFVIEPTAKVPDESVDCLVGAYLRMCRSLIGSDYSPLRIEMRRPRPAAIDDFQTILRAPLYFDASQTKLIFDVPSIERRLDEGNPELAQVNDAVALKYLSLIDRRNIHARVRDVVIRQLSKGEPSQNEVAEVLCMSARTLQRKLGESGDSYAEILEETRRELAIAYLSTAQYSVSDVAFLLGFSATSSFHRAFRRWTGQSPTQWRTRNSPDSANAVQLTGDELYL